MKLLPCKKHPKAFWPWDKPRQEDGCNYLTCPLCDQDAVARNRQHAEDYWIADWNNQQKEEQ